jgi:hypothetical protein
VDERMHGYDPCDAIDERPLLQEASDDTRAAREPDSTSPRKSDDGRDERRREREGSRAAHHLPRLYPESPFQRGFQISFQFFRSTKRRILLPRYREREREESGFIIFDDCLVCFSCVSK